MAVPTPISRKVISQCWQWKKKVGVQVMTSTRTGLIARPSYSLTLFFRCSYPLKRGALA